MRAICARRSGCTGEAPGTALASQLKFAVLISTTTFLSRVAARAQLDPAQCGRLVERAMKALAAQLRPETVRRLSEELPPTLGAWVEQAVFTGARGLAPLLAMEVTLEQIAIVCGALAETLAGPMLTVLRLELHEELAVLLTPQEQHPPDASSWRA